MPPGLLPQRITHTSNCDCATTGRCIYTPAGRPEFAIDKDAPSSASQNPQLLNRSVVYNLMGSYVDDGGVELTELTLAPPGDRARRARRARKNGGGEPAFVKVSMDGTPYLRKVDVASYGDYLELLQELNAMFFCCSIGKPASASETHGQCPDDAKICSLMSVNVCMCRADGRVRGMGARRGVRGRRRRLDARRRRAMGVSKQPLLVQICSYCS
jgi:auxin-responsive protein IAA